MAELKDEAHTSAKYIALPAHFINASRSRRQNRRSIIGRRYGSYLDR